MLVAVGVRQKEDAVSAVGSAGICRLQTSPLRIEPQRGQVSDDSVNSTNSER
jgi:hypothetical protein